MFLFLLQESLLIKARLIRDNRILTVPSAVVARNDTDEEYAVDETVVSTFGALVGDRVYMWGCDGINGVRLVGIEISKSKIALTFGSNVPTLKLELLHGLDIEERVFEVRNRFFHETGIEAKVIGW